MTDLTPDGVLWRDSPLLPKGNADTMVYSARKTTDVASMLLVQTISPSAPRIVFRDPLPGTAIDVTSDGTLIKAYRPIHDVGRIVAPLFIYQGQNDSRVPRAQADSMVRALRERRVPVEYMVAANDGHGIGHRENQVEYLARVVRFLEDQLGMQALVR